MELKYPNMREELVDYLSGLSDLDYQRNVWVAGKSPPGIVHDELDYAIHFIFDDTCLAKNFSSEIGDILFNQEEADAVDALVDALNYIFGKYGLNLTDSGYIEKPERTSVLQAAKAQRICSVEI